MSVTPFPNVGPIIPIRKASEVRKSASTFLTRGPQVRNGMVLICERHLKL